MGNINYVKVGGRMHSTSEGSNPANNHITTGANEVFDDSLNMRQDQVNALIINNDRHVTVVANESTTSIYELLPATGEDNIIYRIAQWDGSQYDPSKYAEYGWNGNDYILLSVSDAAVDEEPTPGSPNPVSSNGVALVDGYYDENPEYIRVYLDAKGKIIKGIKPDGKEYFGVGVETDASITTSVENPEFLTVFNDNDGRIVWAIRKDGDIFYGAGVPKQIIECVKEIIKPFEELLHFEENPEYVDVKLDVENKIAEATRTDGIKVLPAGAEFGGNIVKGDENPEYLEITTDAEDKIISSIDVELEYIRYGGINLSEMKRDADCDVLQCGYDADRLDIYTIENNDSTITMEVDDDLNVYEVKDSHHTAELVMEESGEVYLEQTIKEI